jgi:GAF domain-containing protein
MRACHSLVPEDIAAPSFSGSRSAVERALLHRRPVFSSDQRDRAWLGAQASVVARGLRAIACLPLQHGGELLGVAYADSGDEAKEFTELDAELLGAFVDRASTALAIAMLDEQILGMSSLLAVDANDSRRIGAAPAWPVPQATTGRRA